MDYFRPSDTYRGDERYTQSTTPGNSPVLFLVIGFVDEDPCRLKDPICKCWRRRDVDPAVMSIPHQHPLLQKPGKKREDKRIKGTCSNGKQGAPLAASYYPLGPSFHGLHACPKKTTCLKNVSHPIFGKISIRAPSPVERKPNRKCFTFSSPLLRLCQWK